MTEQIFTNYRLQLPDQELLGTLVVRDNKIAEIQEGIVATGQNGNGDYLIPGLVELHTDNLEKCMSPRPKVHWPLEAAATYHDKDLISAGITTVCDAIALGDVVPNSPRMSNFKPMIDVISEGQKQGRFASDHRLHLRCELGFEKVSAVTETFLDNPLVSLMSLMDHTPGQRQFQDLEKFKTYYMGKHGVKADEVDDFIQQRLDNQAKHADANRQTLVQLANTHQVPWASHDDATVEHVQQAINESATIAEFPTSVAAAQAAHSNGLKVLMGAPNLILGGSHSGNVSALTLLEKKLVDIMSSDYVPRSLLQSAFMAAKALEQPLYETLKLITLNSATAIGLEGDRGSLTVGKRADLVMVHDDGIVPRIMEVYREGDRVA